MKEEGAGNVGNGINLHDERNRRMSKELETVLILVLFLLLVILVIWFI